MKTTLDLPDDVFVAAKQRAASDRTTLRALIERGLRTELGRPASSRSKRTTIRWVTVKGGLPAGVDLADRESMHDWFSRA